MTALPLSRLTDRFQRARLVPSGVNSLVSWITDLSGFSVNHELDHPAETSRAHFGLYFSYVRGTDWCDLAFVLPGNPDPGSFFHSRMGHKLSCNSPRLS